MKHMRIVNGKLYIEFGEMVEAGVCAETMKKAKARGSSCWQFINDPKDARRVLIGWEQLSPNYKKMVEVRYGNPWDYVAKEPILASVVADWKAEEYYRQYRYEVASPIPGEVLEKALPAGVVTKYTRGAAWLAWVNKVLGNKDAAKKEYGLPVLELLEHASALIGMEKERSKMEGLVSLEVLPADFPGSYQRLKEKASRYANLGYEVLIAPEYGNKTAAKIGKVASVAGVPALIGADRQGVMLPENGENSTEIAPIIAGKGGGFDPELYRKQMAVIRSLCAKHQNFDAAQVTEIGNTLFEANGWAKLSISTVRKIIAENKPLLTPGRRGTRTYRSEVARQVKRHVTPIPMVYWTLDGWTVELTYQERGPKGVQYKRMVVVAVLDVHTKYPIGYAIGDRETPDLIKLALRNAVEHTRELFGAMYRPVQLQSDRYQLKTLTPFYQALSHLYTPAAVGNSKGKVVEPYFKYLNKQYCQKKWNWSGHNVTARKENQVNAEYSDRIKNTFPDKGGVVKQIEDIIYWERQAKREDYTATWCNLPEERRYMVSEVEWLRAFGQPLGIRSSKLTGEGLVKQIDGVKYVFDTFDRTFRSHMHLDWMVIGDEAYNGLQKVLAVSVDGAKEYLLEQTRSLPMDLMSSTDADHEYRAQIAAMNKADEQRITDIYGHDADVTYEVVNSSNLRLDDQAALDLKLMYTVRGQQKDRLQDAKKLGASPKELPMPLPTPDEEWQRRREERLHSDIDFSIYQ